MFQEFQRCGFLPVTIEAALMRFRRSRDPGTAASSEDALQAQYEEIARLKKELSDAQRLGAQHEERATELEQRVRELQGELHTLRQQVGFAVSSSSLSLSLSSSLSPSSPSSSHGVGLCGAACD